MAYKIIVSRSGSEKRAHGGPVQHHDGEDAEQRSERHVDALDAGDDETEGRTFSRGDPAAGEEQTDGEAHAENEENQTESQENPAHPAFGISGS